MRSTSFSRAVGAGVALTLVAATIGATSAAAKPSPGRPGRPRAMNLFASAVAVVNVNRLLCPITNTGEVCVDSTLSPVLEGGFWPKGTPDSYIFNSGLQLGGVVGGSASASFPWPGDTVGAFFMDPRGDQAEGEGITQISNSLSPVDAAPGAWPTSAFVFDTALFDPVLLKRAAAGKAAGDGSGIAVSQQDVWVRVWDGNPVFTGSARAHPMGILVEERGMAWNFPTGNEDIIYFIYTFYNISASNCTKYHNPTIGGGDLALQDEVCQVGKQFKTLNDAKYSIQIPADGYDLTNLFAAFFEDCDVGDATANYSTANFVFNLGFCYKKDFLEPNWSFPPDVFAPPLVAAPGFTAVKYLRSPVDPTTNKEIGLSLFSNTLNSATGYPDPVGVHQMYRYLAGINPAAGDNPCSLPGVGGSPLQRHWCFLFQQPVDTRFYMSSGPFTLPAGESRTIVVAYIQAAPTRTVVPLVGGDLKPEFPASPVGLVTAPDSVRVVDSATGWTSPAAIDANVNGRIDQEEVHTVDRSLLRKALVAQTVFDKKFLLPFAPDPPRFFLIPGDNQVTVVWQQSATEDPVTGGDPFFAVANDPTSSLYDPNFRKFDVEGYRVYRGRTASALELVAQFDYAGSTMTDHSGAFAYPGRCAPELGVQTDCPTTFPSATGVDHDLVGNVVQIPVGGRVQLIDQSVLITKADTAVIGGHSGFPELLNTGVPFAFIDRGVRNSFRYVYAVTAFDVNSLASGPSSLESARNTKSVTPRRAGPNTSQALVVQAVLGGDGTPLDPTLPYPTIDPDKGTFNGNMPPANDGLAFVLGTEAIPQGQVISVRIDSVLGGYNADIDPTFPPLMYLTITANGDAATKKLPLPVPGLFDVAAKSWDLGAGVPLVRYDSSEAKRFGVGFTKDTRLPVGFSGKTIPLQVESPAVAFEAGRFGMGTTASRFLLHSRWFADGTAEPADPTITSLADSSHNSGALPGVSKIWSPQALRDRFNRRTNPPGVINTLFEFYSWGQFAWYPGDFIVTWNADSSVSVFDATHHSNLPLAPNGGTGFGFLNVRAIQAAGLTAGDIADGTGVTSTTMITYHDFYAISPSCFEFIGSCTVALERKAQVEPIDFNFDGTSDGDGIALMINGEAFVMTFSGGVIPTAGTKWHLRAPAGEMSATCVDSLGPVMKDCNKYTFTGFGTRPSLAPGLTYKITVQQKYTVDSSKSGDLSRVHTVPDPYYVTNPLEVTANTKVLKFVNLPDRCIIRIYSVSAILVQILTHNDPTGGGEEIWNLRNRNNQFVASGVYFFHLEAPDGNTKVGRFTVVNFAP